LTIDLTTFLVVFIAFLLIHYVYFLLKIYFGLNKLSSFDDPKIPDEFITVIVPFRNEAKNIKNVYESLKNQDYPQDRYEVLFVDDNSTDNSVKLLSDVNHSSNIKIIYVPEDYSRNAHKKRAIRYGIEQSIGEIIVTTDADCIHNKSWLKNLLSYFDEDTAFVAGPVEFIEETNLFQKMQKIEHASLMIVAAGLIGAGNPTICSAANIAYRKKVFYEVDGFLHNMNLSSGDDELLMQKIHHDTEYKIKFVLSKDAVVNTSSNKNVSEFYQQRKRWASKGLFYKNKFLILRLILIYLFYLLLLLQPILGMFSTLFLITFTFSFTIKVVIEYLLMRKGINLLYNPNLLRYFFITEIFQVPYIAIMGLSGAFGNFVWKNRKVNR
jgi:cellulose synthase/poly-beta-1,6-N-acetylglucosamine synthase-like glycosyltransferase